MLKAYSIIKNLDKKACEIIRNAGIKLDISNSDKRPDREGLIKLLDEYDILIIGIEDKFTKDMLPITTKKKINLSVCLRWKKGWFMPLCVG